MTYYYVLLGSFGGSGPVVVGIFDDWDQMLDVIEGGGPGSEPERFEVARLESRNSIRLREDYHRTVWDRCSIPEWQTSDGKRPAGWDNLSEA